MRLVAVFLLVAVVGCGIPVSAPDPLLDEQYAVAQMRLPEAWESATGQGVTIAIIDSGVDLDHPDLEAKLDRGRDFVDGDREPDDENGHGTHVAGIAAAATDNGIGIAGAAPDARILPVRVLDADGSGDPAAIAEAIRWSAAEGADVINLSLGGSSDLLGRLYKNGPMNQAITDVVADGVVVVAAAGNDSTFLQSYRAGVPVIVVNASNELALPAGFSNFGDPRAITAPGARILSTAPLGPTTIWPEGTDGYDVLSGTSMASPYVAGVAALLVEQGLGPREIWDVLVATTVDPNGVFVLSAGLVDAAAAVAGGR
jgi:subtilisin family serine protease